MLGWMKLKLESRLQGEISTTSDMQMIPLKKAGSEGELKSLFIMMKEESEKAGLKLNSQKTRIMAFGSITSWQIDGGKMETLTDFIFLGSKITADDDCSHEIKRHLLLGRKASRQCSKRQRHHFADKGPHSQSYGFPSGHVWM